MRRWLEEVIERRYGVLTNERRNAGFVNVVRDRRTIPALAVTTKSGYMYILNREIGQPIFGVEERSVPKSVQTS